MPDSGIERLMNPDILDAILESSVDGFTYTDETG